MIKSMQPSSIWNRQSQRVADRRQCAAVRKPALQTATILGGRVALGAAMSVALSGLFLTDPVQANPQNATVVSGAATITQNGQVLTIDQASQNLQVNWESFSIGNGETTIFNQPSASSIALNRVTGSDPSAILGNLQSNGQVFLINPNGILFGQNSRVDVGALVATTSNISATNFDAGQYQFDIPSNVAGASIVNDGAITVADTGFAALVAPHVRNNGVIAARLGRIELASAQGFTLDLHGDNLLRFDLGTDPSAVSEDFAALVENAGQLRSDGGVVAIRAKTIGDVVKNVINLDGFVQANTISQKGGKVILSLDGKGVAKVDASISASGSEAGDQGGMVHLEADVLDVTGTVSAAGNAAAGGKVDITGGDVRLLGATVDVSGLQAGRIRVGGEYQGGKNLETDELRNADRVLVNGDAVLRANGQGDTGEAGQVIVWGDKLTQFSGLVDAMQGLATAQGAFVEISSGENLIYRGDIQSRNATILFDPKDITISSAGTDPVPANDTFAENPGLSVTFSAADVASVLTGGNVTLQANNDITVDENITSGSAFTLKLEAGRNVKVNAGRLINLPSGALELVANANNPSRDTGQRDPGPGGIELTGSTIAVGGIFTATVQDGNAEAGNILLGNVNSASVVATANAAGSNISVLGTLDPVGLITLTTNGVLTHGGIINTSVGTVTLTGKSNVLLDGLITARNLQVFATASGTTATSASDGSILSSNNFGTAINVGIGGLTMAGLDVGDDASNNNAFFIGSYNVTSAATTIRAHRDISFFDASNNFGGGVDLQAGRDIRIRSGSNLNIIQATATTGDLSVRMRNGNLTQTGNIVTGDDLRLRMEQDISPGSVFNVNLSNGTNAIGDAVRFEVRQKDGTEGTFGTVDIFNNGSLDVEFAHLTSTSSPISGTNIFNGLVNITSVGDMFLKGNIHSGTTVNAQFNSNLNLLSTTGNMFSCLLCQPGDIGDTNVTVSGAMQMHTPAGGSFIKIEDTNLNVSSLDIVTDKLQLTAVEGQTTIAGQTGKDAWSGAVVSNTSFQSITGSNPDFLINSFTEDGTFVQVATSSSTVQPPEIIDPEDPTTSDDLGQGDEKTGDEQPKDENGNDPSAASNDPAAVEQAEEAISGGAALAEGDILSSEQGQQLVDAAETFSSQTQSPAELTENAEKTGDPEVGETTSDVLGFLEDLNTDTGGEAGIGGSSPIPGDAFGGRSAEVVQGLATFEPTQVASAAPAGSSGSGSVSTGGVAASGQGPSGNARVSEGAAADAAPTGTGVVETGEDGQQAGGQAGVASAAGGGENDGGNAGTVGRQPGAGSGFDSVSPTGRMPVPFVSVGLF